MQTLLQRVCTVCHARLLQHTVPKSFGHVVTSFAHNCPMSMNKAMSVGRKYQLIEMIYKYLDTCEETIKYERRRFFLERFYCDIL